jgi:hypothetical protein
MSFTPLRRYGPLVCAGLAAAACKDTVSPDKQVSVIEISPKSARLYSVGQQQQFTTILTTEAGTDGEGIPVTYVARDKSLIDVTPAGVATALKKGGSTYVVATAGGKSDSALVDVPTTSCGSVAPTTTVVGQVVTDIGGTGFCSAASTGEYAVIVHNTSFAGAGAVAVEVTGIAVGGPPTPAASLSRIVTGNDFGTALHQWRRDVAAEMRFRRQEAGLTASFAASARQWYANRPRRASFSYVPPSVGDMMHVNVNISGVSCTDSTMIDARVAAVSNSAIVLDDPRNPSGGKYTDAEYNEFAQAFDSVINPLDTTQFGSPTDLDGNQRVLIVFTKSVNERTPAGVDYYIGGLTNTRDLLPKAGGAQPCPASNQAEMFYMLVPDSAGVVNTNVFSKSFVTSVTEATLAHEYQHMINFARRRYINAATPQADEVLWLNEGLSHMAEELLYYRKSVRTPRSNIGGSSLSTANETWNQWVFYASGDFLNYDEYVFAPSTTSPFESGDDLATRGATWSFLRYLADQTMPADGRVWYNMVNSGESGVTNNQNRFGLTTASLTGMFRDFVVSTYTDDYVANVAARFTQPSWNMRSIYPRLNQIINASPPFAWPLNGTGLNDGETRNANIQAGGFKVYRFTGIAGANSYITVKGFGGSTLPTGVTISVVRTQ